MTKFLIALAMGFSLSTSLMAEETTSEAVKEKAHDVKRDLKKKAHRIEEAACAEGDAKCLAKKAKNRGSEAKEYMQDKATEMKDKVDSDGK